MKFQPPVLAAKLAACELPAATETRIGFNEREPTWTQNGGEYRRAIVEHFNRIHDWLLRYHSRWKPTGQSRL